MTESEWLACSDPAPMLEFLKGNASDRKLRLFAVACCRRVSRRLPDERSRLAVEVAERFADWSATAAALAAARAGAQDVAGGDYRPGDPRAVAHAPALAARGWHFHYRDEVAWALDVAAAAAGPSEPGRHERPAQADLLRDLFGPTPLRPREPDPRWLTITVLRLTQGIYDEKAFDRLPILADALQDAGCEDAAVLEHCQGTGPNARGCWVVDMVLGKN